MNAYPRTIQAALVTVLASCLVGCADINDLGLAALSTKVQAYAIVDEQLLQGEMVLYPDHTGTLTLRSHLESGTGMIDGAGTPKAGGKPMLSSCVGRMRYTATNAGVVDLRCNDGAVADVRMALIGDTRGYGYGYTAQGLVSAVFGMTPVEARAHLTTPPNKQLMVRSDPAGLEMK